MPGGGIEEFNSDKFDKGGDAKKLLRRGYWASLRSKRA